MQRRFNLLTLTHPRGTWCAQGAVVQSLPSMAADSGRKTGAQKHPSSGTQCSQPGSGSYSNWPAAHILPAAAAEQCCHDCARLPAQWGRSSQSESRSAQSGRGPYDVFSMISLSPYNHQGCSHTIIIIVLIDCPHTIINNVLIQFG